MLKDLFSGGRRGGLGRPKAAGHAHRPCPPTPPACGGSRHDAPATGGAPYLSSQPTLPDPARPVSLATPSPAIFEVHFHPAAKPPPTAVAAVATRSFSSALAPAPRSAAPALAAAAWPALSATPAPSVTLSRASRSPASPDARARAASAAALEWVATFSAARTRVNSAATPCAKSSCTSSTSWAQSASTCSSSHA